MYPSTLLAFTLTLPLLLLPTLAAPDASPAPEVAAAPEVAPAPACPPKRDVWISVEKRSCPYSSCDDCYNRNLNCVQCNNPVGCTGDNPVACTECIIYCNGNCC